MSRRAFFSDIYENNMWQNGESRSGDGSTLSYTQGLVETLPNLIADLSIRTFIDCPCGDFNWMKNVPFPQSCQYIGIDLVEAMIADNERFADENHSFLVADMVTDILPDADLIFIRDCFIHFENALIFQTLRNISRSNIRYIAITNDLREDRFPGANIELDRAKDGVNFEFRPNCFTLPPFLLPKPICNIDDGDSWHLSNGHKAISVWDVDTVIDAIGRTQRA